MVGSKDEVASARVELTFWLACDVEGTVRSLDLLERVKIAALVLGRPSDPFQMALRRKAYHTIHHAPFFRAPPLLLTQGESERFPKALFLC